MKKFSINNHTINQLFLLSILILMCVLVFNNLSYYLSGFLGAVTLYILFRKSYIYLTQEKKWHPSLTSICFIIVSILFIVLPLWWLINYLINQTTSLLGNSDQIIAQFNAIKLYFAKTPLLNYIDLSDASLINFLQNSAKYIPILLNSLAGAVVNIIVTFFVLYFMQIHYRQMENFLKENIPYSRESNQEIWHEIDLMVKSNAIGIPILGLCQGIVAILGYFIFGIENAILWGLLTGAATIIPVIGTMIIWVPICIYLLAINEISNAVFLALYCFFMVGGIDNILRFTILKKLGDVPPLITVFGVLLGLKLFGMLGLIFGPLILSAIGVLFKVYKKEYNTSKKEVIIIDNNKIDNPES